jgi:hypothetical protein
MGPRFDGSGDFRQVKRHGLGVAARQHQGRALALFGADGAEDVGRAGALIARRARPGAAPGPPAGDLVLLADARLVLEPNLYALALRLLGGDLRPLGGEVFLNAAIAS